MMTPVRAASQPPSPTLPRMTGLSARIAVADLFSDRTHVIELRDAGGRVLGARDNYQSIRDAMTAARSVHAALGLPIAVVQSYYSPDGRGQGNPRGIFLAPLLPVAGGEVDRDSLGARNALLWKGAIRTGDVVTAGSALADSRTGILGVSVQDEEVPAFGKQVNAIQAIVLPGRELTRSGHVRWATSVEPLGI